MHDSPQEQEISAKYILQETEAVNRQILQYKLQKSSVLENFILQSAQLLGLR